VTSDTSPGSGLMPFARIDPLAPRHPGLLEPPVRERLYIPAFTAAHVLLFGTDYTAGDYANEARARLQAGEELCWYADSAYLLGVLQSCLDKYEVVAAAMTYADAIDPGPRSLAIRINHALAVLQEAATRGEITVLAHPLGAPNTKLVQLEPTDFLRRPRISPSGALSRWPETIDERYPQKEYQDLTFRRDEVITLRMAPWHTISHGAPANEDLPGRSVHGADARPYNHRARLEWAARRQRALQGVRYRSASAYGLADAFAEAEAPGATSKERQKNRDRIIKAIGPLDEKDLARLTSIAMEE